MQTAIDSSRRKSGLRLTGGTKLAIIGATIMAVLYLGWTYGVGWWITSKHFTPLRPGKVSLIGLQTGHGYSVLVSNRAAQLVEAKDYDFTAPSSDAGEDGPEGASKKRIPVREMIDSLNGDETALSTFVTVLGGLEAKEDWPSQSPQWTSEDIQKALDGDPKLSAKLEQDLNVHLDGKPVLDHLSTSALDNGIMISTPVPVKVQVGGEEKTLHARVKRWYLPQLMQETAKKFEKLFKVTNQQKLGYYMAAIKEEQEGKKFEDVRSTLKKFVSDADLREAADKAERILGSAQVILTNDFIEKATYAPSEVGIGDLDKGKPGMFDLDIHVTDEGKLRLWQYSKLHPHDQLLLVSNGVAIAAPRIKQELVKPDLTIIQMPDEGLLQQAVETINNKK